MGGALFAIVHGRARRRSASTSSTTSPPPSGRCAGPATSGGILTVLLAWGYDPDERGVVLGLALSLVLVAIAGLILPRRDDITARMATTFLGVVYLGVPLAVLVLTRELPHGAAAVVNVLVGVWVFDTASYLGGRMWGKTPIAPRTSPGKTVEGAVVGLLAGTLAVWIAGLYMDWISGWESLLLGLAICPAAYLGDLFESMLKRDAGAKDSGRLLLGPRRGARPLRRPALRGAGGVLRDGVARLLSPGVQRASCGPAGTRLRALAGPSGRPAHRLRRGGRRKVNTTALRPPGPREARRGLGR